MIAEDLQSDEGSMAELMTEPVTVEAILRVFRDNGVVMEWIGECSVGVAYTAFVGVWKKGQNFVTAAKHWQETLANSLGTCSDAAAFGYDPVTGKLWAYIDKKTLTIP